MTTFDLRTLRIRSGDQARGRDEIELEPLLFGGQAYEPRPNPAPAGAAGGVERHRPRARVRRDAQGPCFRCLTDAELSVALSLREYEATKPRAMTSRPNTSWTTGWTSAWAHDAIALALPDKILCRPDCAGLCPICGKDLNAEPHEHVEEVWDPRWEKLSQLRDES